MHYAVELFNGDGVAWHALCHCLHVGISASDNHETNVIIDEGRVWWCKNDNLHYWVETPLTDFQTFSQFKSRVSFYLDENGYEGRTARMDRVVVLVPSRLHAHFATLCDTNLTQQQVDCIFVVKNLSEFKDALNITEVTEEFKQSMYMHRMLTYSDLEDPQAQQFFETVSNPIQVSISIESPRQPRQQSTSTGSNRRRTPTSSTRGRIRPNNARNRIQRKKIPPLVAEERVREIDDEPPRTMTRKEMECIICADNAKNTLCLPCAHLCMCETCSLKLDKRICPICRKDIEGTERVFF